MALETTLRLRNTDESVNSIAGSAQVHRIYNHDIMNCTADGVSGNDLYSARALGMTSTEDVIQLSPKLKPDWDFICAHYARIGLNHTRNVIWDTDLAHISRNSDYQPSVFFFGDHENAVHQNPAWAKTVEFINSKNQFVPLAAELGVPVPQTICFERVDAITARDIDGFVFPCYLKAAVSVSGVGIYRCESPAAMSEAIGNFDPSTPVQVQEEVVTDCFLNMQYQIENGECKRLLTTEQILEGSAHQGNRFPARCEPWEIVEPVAEWMAERGFEDVFAFDVAVIEQDGGTRFLAIECNPRFNGSSYPTAIAMKLEIQEWDAHYFKTWRRTLSGIELRDLEYNAETGEGIIIVNWGPILVGKIMVMLAGPAAVRERLGVELTRRIW